jgi:hypothetical protein
VSLNISKLNARTERADLKILKTTTAGLGVPAIGYMKQLFRLLTGQPVSSNSSKDHYSGRGGCLEKSERKKKKSLLRRFAWRLPSKISKAVNSFNPTDCLLEFPTCLIIYEE